MTFINTIMARGALMNKVIKSPAAKLTINHLTVSSGVILWRKTETRLYKFTKTNKMAIRGLSLAIYSSNSTLCKIPLGCFLPSECGKVNHK